jgi:hypothetical protein
MNLLETWKKWTPSPPHLVLNQDEEFLTKNPDKLVVYNWKSFLQDPCFGLRGDKKLHLGLIPQPFVGDLKRASIYILLLNPGLSPSDYYGEYRVPEFRSALLNNLKQKWPSGRTPFLFLDPRFSWHEGYKWWNEKLLGVVEELAKFWNVPLAEARRKLAGQLASIELFPYHSKSFGNHNLLNKLQSTKLVRNFVYDQVKRGKAIVIVTRKAKEWKLPKLAGSRVIQYKPHEARAAHLTPKSPGGEAILRHLKSLQP